MDGWLDNRDFCIDEPTGGLGSLDSRHAIALRNQILKQSKTGKRAKGRMERVLGRGYGLEFLHQGSGEGISIVFTN